MALQALFELDTVGHSPETAVNRLVEGTETAGETEKFALELVRGVIENRERIDETIRLTAPAWPLDQIAAVDRNIPQTCHIRNPHR